MHVISCRDFVAGVCHLQCILLGRLQSKDVVAVAADAVHHLICDVDDNLFGKQNFPATPTADGPNDDDD